jgi:heme/copper-type cytochrome/quinol oxidase subunit 3
MAVMRDQVRLGMTFLLVADALFFFFLIVAYIYFREESLRTAALSLDWRVAAQWTACLAASSVTMWMASRGSRRRLWLGLTLALGAAFLLGQGQEYLRILRDGIAVTQGLFATTFFTLAGVHGLHLAIGIVLIAILLLIGDSTEKYSVALGAVALYWYFLAAAWIAIFSIVYVWTFV